MGSVSQMAMYEVADTLGFEVSYSSATGRVQGAGQNVLAFGNLPITFNSRIVSSALLKQSILLMVRVKGNLALLVEVTGDRNPKTKVHLLNRAHMDPIDNWLEEKKPKTPAACLKLLGKAVVKSFQKTPVKGWTEL
ncbi:hypothetical protein [Nitratireductor sp. OM-1]|uniref:hypothetical protein n=1 Tax=Nitratireductor sp. OM-1 TaxID=1756988 RepID=UPI000DDD1A9A|nr:hypothetical protein [Nitratireductor sp. OM-1]